MEYINTALITLSFLWGAIHRYLRIKNESKFNQPLKFLLLIQFGGCGVTCLLIVMAWVAEQCQLNTIASALWGFQIYWLVVPFVALICLAGYLVGSLVAGVLYKLKRYLAAFGESPERKQPARLMGETDAHKL